MEQDRGAHIRELHRYYADKKWCGLDMDKLAWKYDSDNPVPSTHPIIKYRLFIKDIGDRNRYQETLAEIERHGSFELARRIHSCDRRTLPGIIEDLRERIKAAQIKIEKFHSEYLI